MSMVKVQEQTPAIYNQPDDLALATNALASKLLPESIDTPQKALLIIAKGRELGIKPMASFKHMFVIKNQVGMDSALIANLFQRRGHSFMPVKRGADECTIRFTHRNGSTYTHTLTRAEVTRARWDQRYDYDKKQWVLKDQWEKMPEVMLAYRTLTTGIRMVDPGALLGTMSDDELFDVGAVDTEPYIDGQAQVVEPEPTTAPIMSGIVVPEPNSGWETWGAVKQRGFWAAVRKAMTEEQAHQEFGVESMKAWEYSIDQTRPALELLAWEPEMALEEKKKALGIDKLREVVEYGWSLEECKEAINPSTGGAQ